jgi:hypothetical protein
MLPTISVWPSAGLRASAAPPIVPPAPGWLSTTMIWPILGDTNSEKARATVSTPPPGG